MVGVDKNVKMQGWERKSILRNTIGRTLPSSLLKAPKKGFGIPLREWFKDDSFINTVDTNIKAVKNLLDKKMLDEIVFANKKGLSDNGSFIWTMMLLNNAIR